MKGKGGGKVKGMECEGTGIGSGDEEGRGGMGE